MGYRLEISKLEYCACGGKLFGYVDNIEELKSWQWLKEHRFIDEDAYFTYGFNPRIILYDNEFEKFITLYIEDLKKENAIPFDEVDMKKINKLIKDKSTVILEWG